MQAYKLFMKILRIKNGYFIMYTVIYCVLLFGVIIPANKNSAMTGYVDQKCKYAILDEDNSDLSQALATSLESTHTKVSISDFEKETLQDELYARNIRAAVWIKPGFQEAFNEGKAKDCLTVYDVPADSAAKLFTGDVEEFLRYTDGLMASGYTPKEAADRASEIIGEKAEVTVYNKSEVTGSGISLFFNYLGWLLILICVLTISPILNTLDEENARRRIQCSPFEFGKMNGQIFLGVLTFGVIIVATFGIVGKVYFGTSLGGTEMLLYYTNLACYTVMSLALTFLTSKLVSNEMVVNLVSNVIGLGMAFLCGIFVPMSLLSDTVLTIAKFLPAYWYVIAIQKIEMYSEGMLRPILGCFGLQLLFAGLFVIFALVAANRKRVRS